MCCKSLKSAFACTLAIAVALAGVVALAQDQQSKGRIIRIGPDDQGQVTTTMPAPNNNAERQPAAPAPAYWIGIVFGPVNPELRAHIDLPENQGLLVREIMPGSPASKTGLKQYDILLRANDVQLNDRNNLVEMVRTEGEKQGQITLDVFRKGQGQSITVKPETRPADVAQGQAGFGQGGFGQGGFGQGELFQGEAGQPMLGQLRHLFGELDGNGGNGKFEFRQFGPGVIVGGGGGAGNIPDGVSISVKKENNKPARVTVKRGDQTWEAVEGDQDSLDSLPADLQPYVERMLKGGGNRAFQFNGAMPQMNFPADAEQTMQKRLEQLEKQIQQLMEQSRGNRPAAEQAK